MMWGIMIKNTNSENKINSYDGGLMHMERRHVVTACSGDRWYRGHENLVGCILCLL